MTTCKDIQEQFVDALYGGLDAERRQAFDAHLRTCAVCAASFAKMRTTLSVMDKRAYPEPPADLWQKLSPRLGEKSRPRILSWVPQRMPAWSYAVAAAIVLAVGIYIGRTLSQRTVEAPAPQTAATALPDSTTEQALAYFERSRNLLIGLTNIDEEHAGSFDYSRQQKISRTLIDQGNVLTVALNRPNQQQMRRLVQDLQIILLQLANIEVKPGVPAIELVKKGVDEKSILLKINLEEMRSMASRPVKAQSPKQPSSTL